MAEETQVKEIQKNRWRWFQRIVLGLIILLLVPTVFLLTGYGQRTLITFTDKHIALFSIDEVEGSLQEGLTLKNFHLNTGGVNIDIKKTDLKLSLSCLLKMEVCAENLAFIEPKIIIDSSKFSPSEQKKETPPIDEITLPIDVVVKQVSVEKLQLEINKMTLQLDHFSGGATAKGKQVTVLPTKFSDLTLLLAPNDGTEDKAQAEPKEKKSANDTKIDLNKALLSKIAPIKLPMNFFISDFQGKNIHIMQKTAKSGALSWVKIVSLELEAKSNEHDVELNHLRIISDKGNVSVEGKLSLNDNYPLNVQLNASLPELNAFKIPESTASLTLTGELFGITRVEVNATGRVNAKLQGDIQLARPKTPLNIILKSPAVSYPFTLAKGQEQLRWENVDLSLKGDLVNYQLVVGQSQLIYGENKIDLKGVLGDASNFQMDIKTPNLVGFVPDLKAGINGAIKISGNVSKPNIEFDLSANNVSYQQLKLRNLIAKGKVSSEQEISGNVNVALHQFAYNDIKVEHADLNLSGNEQKHSLKLVSKGEPVGINLQIVGYFDRLQQLWQGQLSDVIIHSPMGQWANNQAIKVNYDNRQVMADISAHCWQNPKLVICFPTAFKAGQEGNVPFEIKHFDLSAIQEYLAKNSQLSGIVNAKGNAAWFKTKAPEVNIELNSENLKFVQQIEYKVIPLTFSPVKVKAKLANNELKLDTDIHIEHNGKMVSDLTIKDIAKTRLLSGNLDLEKISLKILEPLLDKGDKINGEINARLKFGGTATTPLLNGHLTASNLLVKSYMIPFDVTGGGLSLNFVGASSTLKGSLKTKESELFLEGEANWRNLEAWHTRLRAKAERFRIAIPNIAKVDLSPNIEVKVTPSELILGGNIDIPWARIEVEELPDSAVSVSSDEVIMDGMVKNKVKETLTLPQNTRSGMAIKADVNIHLGDDVKLNAYGLKTKLNGTIVARQGNKGLGLYGQIGLKNGSFSSFGQDLIIRKGEIIFAGLPSQPTLNIEAIRNPESIEDTKVTAGVRVMGLADSPEVTVFSEPAMSQDQALSYILTGRGLENSSDAGSSNSIAAALIGMSLSKSSKLVGGIGSTFGITDLNVTTAGIGDNTKVVVSGSLTPKFKVKYGVGIFAPLTELTLRYRLATNLYLQWVSSINQAVDLIYNFEFD